MCVIIQEGKAETIHPKNNATSGGLESKAVFQLAECQQIFVICQNKMELELSCQCKINVVFCINSGNYVWEFDLNLLKFLCTGMF